MVPSHPSLTFASPYEISVWQLLRNPSIVLYTLTLHIARRPIVRLLLLLDVLQSVYAEYVGGFSQDERISTICAVVIGSDCQKALPNHSPAQHIEGRQ